MKTIYEVKPIGVIHSPFKQIEDTPIQPVFAEGTEGTIELLPEYAEGISDLDGFERIWLIYFFDRVRNVKLKVVPFRDTIERGIFATRAPARPNAVGLSAVRLIGIEGSNLKVADIDILDGTPLIDIKPYIPQVDSFPDSKAGWFESKSADRKRADGRFE
jgi:tRNA-Thr(GGU) m(6)t(6)A37 methyltransferase TsaA